MDRPYWKSMERFTTRFRTLEQYVQTFCKMISGKNTIFAELAGDADFEEVFIDSTIVRVYQHAAGAPKKTVTSRLGVLAED